MGGVGEKNPYAVHTRVHISTELSRRMEQQHDLNESGQRVREREKKAHSTCKRASLIETMVGHMNRSVGESKRKCETCAAKWQVLILY